MTDAGTSGAAPAAGADGGQPSGAAPAGGAPAAGGKPADGGGQPASGAQFSLPEAYKDKPWAKDFKSADDVFKSLENAQQFIGRKGFGVPGEKATPEEKAQFFKELGVPDDPKGYEFKRPDNVPEEMWNTEHETKWAGLMKQHNVPKSVANELRNEMIKETLEMHNSTIKTLNESLDKAFGENKATITKEVGDMMQKAIPDKALREAIEKNIGSKNTPAFALALGHVLQHMKKTYGMSDTNTGDGGDGTSGKSIKDMRAEATKLMASEAYTNVMHKDHAETRKQVDGLYTDIGKLTDAQRKSKT